MAGCGLGALYRNKKDLCSAELKRSIMLCAWFLLCATWYFGLTHLAGEATFVSDCGNHWVLGRIDRWLNHFRASDGQTRKLPRVQKGFMQWWEFQCGTESFRELRACIIFSTCMASFNMFSFLQEGKVALQIAFQRSWTAKAASQRLEKHWHWFGQEITVQKKSECHEFCIL